MQLEDASVWDNPQQAQALGREKSELEGLVVNFEELSQGAEDSLELLELAKLEDDEETLSQIADDTRQILKGVEGLEFRRMFSGEADANNAFLDIQSGSGGTEAQDWAEMLLRMYLRWGEAQGYKVELIEKSPGDVAGIKSATIKFSGKYAYGYLRTELGVHRLVRISPFDSQSRRHTSFASAHVYPEVDDNVDLDIPEKDIRIDRYCSSGPGGQGVNTTYSAVRVVHEPSGVIVTCQNERSQIKNLASAMKVLRAGLYELEMQKREEEMDKLKGPKKDISWGNQIRSYVLQPYRMVKDLRTEHEVGNADRVLDGDIDDFIEAFLHWNAQQEATQ